MGSMTGLHVLIVPAWWPSKEQPGAGVFCADYAAAFSAAGAKVGVVFPDLISMRFLGKGPPIPWRPRILAEKTAGAEVIRIRGLHWAMGRPWIQMHRFRRWLRRGLAIYRERHGSPDVLLAMCAIPSGWACTHLDDPLAGRVVVTEHLGPFSLALEPPAAGRYVRAAMDKAATVVAVSHRSREEMRAAGISREIMVCGNPVARVFAPAAIQTEQPTGPLKALFVGRLVREKGIAELIEAAVALGGEPEIEWHFAGDGPMASEIDSRFLAAGLRDRLFMHGHCERTTVAKLMAESDFLVLPTHGETFGLVAAEALCKGLPVVTTRGTACGDYVNENNGLLVEIGDAKSLAAGLREMLQHCRRYDRPAIAAQARERFSGEAVAARYGEVFRRVIGEG